MNRVTPLARPLRIFKDAEQRELDRISTAVRTLQGSEILDGNLIADVSLTTSDTQIRHGLGRKLRGWKVVDIDADARVWRSAVSTTSVLTLRASASTTVTLWVF